MRAVAVNDLRPVLNTLATSSVRAVTWRHCWVRGFQPETYIGVLECIGHSQSIRISRMRRSTDRLTVTWPKPPLNKAKAPPHVAHAKTLLASILGKMLAGSAKDSTWQSNLRSTELVELSNWPITCREHMRAAASGQNTRSENFQWPTEARFRVPVSALPDRARPCHPFQLARSCS